MPKGAPRAAADVEEDCRSEGSGGVCDGSEADSPRLELSGVAAAALQQFYADQQQQSNLDPFAADFWLSQVGACMACLQWQGSVYLRQWQATALQKMQRFPCDTLST